VNDLPALYRRAVLGGGMTGAAVVRPLLWGGSRQPSIGTAARQISVTIKSVPADDDREVARNANHPDEARTKTKQNPDKVTVGYESSPN